MMIEDDIKIFGADLSNDNSSVREGPTEQWIKASQLKNNSQLLNYILSDPELLARVQERLNPPPQARVVLDADSQRAEVALAIARLLTALGVEDTDGTHDTPRRVAKFYVDEFTAGLRADPEAILGVTFDVEHNSLVAVHNIPFYSLCEHHLVPFYGKCHVGYIPKNKVVGLSKIARLVDTLARRPNVQERLTQNIVKAIDSVLMPQGVIVVMTAEHLCMTMRGIRVPGALTTTSAIRGVFMHVESARNEFFSLIK